ncbi:leukocyte elastase inhibitor isoform X2 [Anabrus simplex]|uniref:leukocyte elastase inhibitor isoform X2 n=1 Tax=Anabrus simplex TaxID=316456 RepID=UPI0034DD1FE0
MWRVKALLLYLVIGWSSCQQSESEQNRLAVVQASNAFTTALYQILSRQFGNMITSPLSANVVLAMAWLGADGETARQLAKGLYLPQDRLQVESGFKMLLSSLKSTEGVTLDIANKMYVQKGFRVKDEFRKTVVDNFLSDVEQVDFTKNPRAARSLINQWVEERTQGKIRDLVSPGTLSGYTLLVLINAIYFKGDWQKAFEESSTVMAPFRLTRYVFVNVPMMQQTGTFSYGDFPELKFKALRLPYKGGTTSMLVILPDEIEGFKLLEANIVSLNIPDILTRMEEQEVNVFLPRFKIERTMNLQRILEQLGIMDIFKDGANFSGITDQGIYVSNIVQKAFIEVNENGTVAAAATEVDFDWRIGTPSAIFKADHPFLFFILDDASGAILFMGRVMQPKQ